MTQNIIKISELYLLKCLSHTISISSTVWPIAYEAQLHEGNSLQFLLQPKLIISANLLWLWFPDLRSKKFLLSGL